MVDHRRAISRYAASKYVLGELSQAEREEFEEHFFSCVECAEDVRTLMTISSNSKVFSEMAGYVEPSAAGSLRPGDWFAAFLSWRPRLVYAMAPVCALLVLTGFTTYESMALRKQVVPQAVAQFALRPDARGEETVIAGAAVGPFFLLSADAPGTAQEVKWQIRSRERRAALMEGTAPTPGSSLTLLIPASKFKAGQYVLSLWEDPAPTAIPTQLVYRFRVH